MGSCGSGLLGGRLLARGRMGLSGLRLNRGLRLGVHVSGHRGRCRRRGHSRRRSGLPTGVRLEVGHPLLVRVLNGPIAHVGMSEQRSRRGAEGRIPGPARLGSCGIRG